jgi:hypothetical protein
MTQRGTTGIEENLVGRTTRPVLFSDGDHRVRRPAGTEVYVTASRGTGQFLVRIPGTLFTQTVYAATVESI